jgi:hypothetical protein
MTAKNRYSRGKAKKQSLASRKREKDVSRALLENVFQSKPETIQPMKRDWEKAVPRKMQILMRAAEGKGVRRLSHREDVPRDKPSAGKHSKAQKAAAKAEAPAGQASSSAPAAAPPAGGTPRNADHAAPPSHPETAAAEADRKRADADALGAALAARAAAHQAKPKPKQAKPPGFGATNNQPPELKIHGRFGRIAAAAAANGGASSRAKEITKQRVLENYAAAKEQRKRPNVAIGGAAFS